jgi:Carbohydrate binding module (family 6)
VFRTDGSLARYIELGVYYGLEPVAYEGGPDTFGPNNVAAKKGASFDPRMADLVQRYLAEMSARGMGLLNWYLGGATSWDTQYGTWGLTDDMTNQGTPKIQGIDAFRSAAPPQLDAGMAVPGEVDARLYNARLPPFSDPYVRYIGADSAFDYLVRSASSTTYDLRVSVATTNSGAPLDVLVNGGAAQTVAVPASGNWDTFIDTAPVQVSLKEGLNVVRLHAPASMLYNLQSLKIAQR